MTITEGMSILTSVASLIGVYILWRKLKPDMQKTQSEGLHEDASAAEIFQRMLTEEALSKSKTMASMQTQIDNLILVGRAYEKQISDLTAMITTEQAARRELEATVVRLNNELAEVKKERLIVLASLESLKTWAIKFMDWAEKQQLISQLKELGIIPVPFTNRTEEG
jgi:hypothetical protein